ncbi:uncharacterized protein FOBCDRAFT_236695 [Fusarium oxysporum Fo47]|uniref:uncharacterized protein n=1 Tax=Fusarium oxysporum Fo47 TaxID=660027 RepID=UPI0028699156|nr:uncharacterized protein FOBCDRAFT_236695 [Fusarium oxysporum Fo47]QKD49258.2 hypothetical protein FOBCDRAFT_236695 [Fusarium oxysporum Fo47]
MHHDTFRRGASDHAIVVTYFSTYPGQRDKHANAGLVLGGTSDTQFIMDPLSIATGCATLISTIGSLSLSINSFVRTCREARGDLDRVARELLSLQKVLELIQEDVADESKTFPTTLEQHVSGIVTNCNSVVVELQECITKYGGDNRLKSKAGWAINGQGDVAKLRSNLEQRLPKQGGNDYILQNFLEEMTTYTEKTMDGASIDGGDSSTKASSLVLEKEEGSDKPSDPAYLSDWELDSAASDPVSYKLKKKRWEEQKRQERLAETKLKDVQRSLESPQQHIQQPIAFHHSGHRQPSEEDDELVVPPDDAYLEEWEKSSVESETKYWEKKEKEWQAHVNQAYLGEVERLTTSAQSTSSQDDARGVAGIHYPDHARVHERQIFEDRSTETSQAAQERYNERYSHDYENDEPEVTKGVSTNSSKTDRLTISGYDVLSETPDFSYLGVETFHGKLVINWPMLIAVTDLLSEDYYIESSCNSFTALTCSTQEFPSQKDTLRPKRYLKPRDIKIVFYIPVTTMTTSSVFKRQWEFITTAVVGFSRRLDLSDDVPPPWHNIVIVVEGPPRWDGIHPEIEIILTELGILYKTDNLVSKVDGVLLDPPYHKDHCKVFGKMICGTIHEYNQQSAPNTPVPRTSWVLNRSK